MIARYWSDLLGVYIHTNFNMPEKMRDDFETFQKRLEDIKGVENVAVNKYSLAVMFGLLFDERIITAQVLDVFQRYTGVSAETRLTHEEVEGKLRGNPINLSPSFNMDPFDA